MPSVLFVSHDVDLCAVAARVLTRSGSAVTVAAHGGHASLACMDRGPFDVMIIENQMPEGSGHAIAERLRRYCPDMQVVRMSDTAGSGFQDDDLPLVRPFTADDLIQATVAAADPAQARRGATIR
jgi:CheY-like chemotaxis protein